MFREYLSFVTHVRLSQQKNHQGESIHLDLCLPLIRAQGSCRGICKGVRYLIGFSTHAMHSSALLNTTSHFTYSPLARCLTRLFTPSIGMTVWPPALRPACMPSMATLSLESIRVSSSGSPVPTREPRGRTRTQLKEGVKAYGLVTTAQKKVVRLRTVQRCFLNISRMRCRKNRHVSEYISMDDKWRPSRPCAPLSPSNQSFKTFGKRIGTTKVCIRHAAKGTQHHTPPRSYQSNLTAFTFYSK